MRLLRMKVRHLVIAVALAAIASALCAHMIRRDRKLLHTMAQFAVMKATRDLGDLSQFEMTAQWKDGDVQVDFKPEVRGEDGRRYVVGFIGEILSAQPLPGR